MLAQRGETHKKPARLWTENRKKGKIEKPGPGGGGWGGPSSSTRRMQKNICTANGVIARPGEGGTKKYNLDNGKRNPART